MIERLVERRNHKRLVEGGSNHEHSDHKVRCGIFRFKLQAGICSEGDLLFAHQVRGGVGQGAVLCSQQHLIGASSLDGRSEVTNTDDQLGVSRSSGIRPQFELAR
jgi:hypothetical protein